MFVVLRQIQKERLVWQMLVDFSSAQVMGEVRSSISRHLCWSAISCTSEYFQLEVELEVLVGPYEIAGDG